MLNNRVNDTNIQKRCEIFLFCKTFISRMNREIRYVTLYFRGRILISRMGSFSHRLIKNWKVMKEREEKKKEVASDDRRARNIPSKQDKSWVGEQ